MVSQRQTDDEFLNVPVPRRLYPLVIQTLANALGGESSFPAEASPPVHASNPGPAIPALKPPPTARPWTVEELQVLRRSQNPTVEALLDLTCAAPGKRVTFQEVYERAGRSYGQARADLAGFTRLIVKTLGREAWPVNVVQGPEGLTYHADPAVAELWKPVARSRSREK